MRLYSKLFFTTLCLALVLISCKDENSIQTYFVDHQDLPAFSSFDVSAKMIDFSKSNLSEAEKAAYESIRKLDILAYKVNNEDVEAYKTELAKAKTVFANKKHEELLEFKDNGITIQISTIGNKEAVDEFLILASSKDKGFTVVRVLGDDMKPEELVKLVDKLKNADVDKDQLKNIVDLFNN